MFSGKLNHAETIRSANGAELVFHEIAEAAFDWEGSNTHSFNRLFVPVSAGIPRNTVANLTGGVQFELKPGHAYLMPAGAKLGFRFFRDNYFLSFHFNLLCGGIERIERRDQLLERELTAGERNAARAALGNPLSAKAFLYGILPKFGIGIPSPDPAAEHYAPLLKFMREKLDAQTTVGALAENMGCSADTLSRGFSGAFGIPLKRYMTRLLVSKAEKLLRTPGIRIRDAAFRLGFSDEYYFSRFFRRETGSTPSSFRKY